MIFYFTATGNGLYAAKSLQKSLGGALHFIPDLLQKNTLTFSAASDEYVGFVFPVFFWGLPTILPRFVEALQLTGAQAERTFILATMGGTSGTANEQLEGLLAKKGIRAGYKFAIPMPDNYIPIYTMPTQEEAETQLDTADQKLEEAARQILAGNTGDYNENKGPLPKLVSPLAQAVYPKKTRKFYANDACIGCGLCEKICPVQAISVTDGRPKWVKATCETCLACLQRCPTQAIQRGKDSRAKGRYVNPRVTF